MTLARSLSGAHAGENDQAAPEKSEEKTGDDLGAVLGQVDPELVRKGVELIQGAGDQNDRGSTLLTALRPYLKKEKQERLDRALQMAQTMRLIRTAIGAFGGKGGSGDV